MKREVVDTPLQAIGLVPEDFSQHAERALAALPDEFDAAFCGPAFDAVDVTDEDGLPARWPTAYLGAHVILVRGKRYARFLVERPEDLLHDDVRADYLHRVRDALEHPT